MQIVYKPAAVLDKNITGPRHSAGESSPRGVMSSPSRLGGLERVRKRILAFVKATERSFLHLYADALSSSNCVSCHNGLGEGPYQMHPSPTKNRARYKPENFAEYFSGNVVFFQLLVWWCFATPLQGFVEETTSATQYITMCTYLCLTVVARTCNIATQPQAGDTPDFCCRILLCDLLCNESLQHVSYMNSFTSN